MLPSLLLALSASAQNRLLITGSSTMAPLVTVLAKQFQTTNPQAQIEVRTAHSQVGASDAMAGRSDLGMVARTLHSDESSLFAITIARDGIALAVHASNPVTALTRAQAADVLTGRIRNWKALGGRDAAIEVATRPPGYSSLEIACHYLQITPDSIKASRVVASNADALKHIASSPDTISFLSAGSVEREGASGAPVKSLALDGVAATSATIRDARYLMSRPLNLVSRSVPSGLARRFVEYVQSGATRATLVDFDFVPFLPQGAQ